MLAKLQKLKDRLTIWAILRLGIKLPDLQQTQKPIPGTIYYYFGRWVKLIRHHSDINGKTFSELSPDELGSLICSDCALHRLGLPCKKVDGGTKKDLCYTHYYKLIKGKTYEEV